MLINPCHALPSAQTSTMKHDHLESFLKENNPLSFAGCRAIKRETFRFQVLSVNFMLVKKPRISMLLS